MSGRAYIQHIYRIGRKIDKIDYVVQVLGSGLRTMSS